VDQHSELSHSADVSLWLHLTPTEAIRRWQRRDQLSATAEQAANLHHVDDAYDLLAQSDARLTRIEAGALEPEAVHARLHAALEPPFHAISRRAAATASTV
jgi:thymidylate kinase